MRTPTALMHWLLQWQISVLPVNKLSRTLKFFVRELLKYLTRININHINSEKYIIYIMDTNKGEFNFVTGIGK